MSFKLLEFSALTPSEQAAWVQAIGTLIAIAIAIAMPVALDQMRKKRADRARDVRARALMLSILPDLYKLWASTRHFLSEQSGASTDGPREIDELHGDYFSHAEAFQRILAATPELGTYGAKLANLVYVLFRAREMLDTVTRLQAGGHHVAYINNIEEFVRYATDIDAATEDLIRAVEDAHGERDR